MTEQELSDNLGRIASDLAAITADLEKALADKFGDILVSCLEAGRHLGVSQSTVTRYLKEGRLRKTTIGESTGIRFSDILEIKAS